MSSSRKSLLVRRLTKNSDVRASGVKKPRAAATLPLDELSTEDQQLWRAILRACPGLSATVTPFQQRVYLLCTRIPQGKVTTYGAMATALSSSARAVGQALRHNPFAPVVPCHRVVRSDCHIGGFSGQFGPGNPTVAKKIKLLREERVEVDQDYVQKAFCMQDACAVADLPAPAALACKP